MKWTLPLYVVVEAANQEDAKQKVAKAESMLKNPMVKMLLAQERIQLHQIYAGTPQPTTNGSSK